MGGSEEPNKLTYNVPARSRKIKQVRRTETDRQGKDILLDMIRKDLPRKLIFGHKMRRLSVSDLEEELLSFKAGGQYITLHIFIPDFQGCLQTVLKRSIKSELFCKF